MQLAGGLRPRTRTAANECTAVVDGYSGDWADRRIEAGGCGTADRRRFVCLMREYRLIGPGFQVTLRLCRELVVTTSPAILPVAARPCWPALRRCSICHGLPVPGPGPSRAVHRSVNALLTSAGTETVKSRPGALAFWAFTHPRRGEGAGPGVAAAHRGAARRGVARSGNNG